MEFPSLNTISKRRKNLGITQKKLAAAAGISQSLLTKIERGLVIPRYNTAISIFNALEYNEYPNEKKAYEVMSEKVITLKASNTVEKAAEVSKRTGISQFPVTDKNEIVGSISTSDMIWAQPNEKIGSIMGDPFPIVSKNFPLSLVKSTLKSSKAVLVAYKGRIAGIITAEDLL
ncbi:MAG: CBS domain-containing protein [Candidatus Micrarchaeia archaeon]